MIKTIHKTDNNKRAAIIRKVWGSWNEIREVIWRNKRALANLSDGYGYNDEYDVVQVSDISELKGLFATNQKRKEKADFNSDTIVEAINNCELYILTLTRD